MMNIEVNVTDQQIANLLVSAFEGGSNYWYVIARTRKPKGKNPDKWAYRESRFQKVYPHVDYPLNEGGHLVIKQTADDDGPSARILNRERLEAGMRAMAASKDYRHHFLDVLKDDTDQITGDVYLQFCLYGDVLFG